MVLTGSRIRRIVLIITGSGLILKSIQIHSEFCKLTKQMAPLKRKTVSFAIEKSVSFSGRR